MPNWNDPITYGIAVRHEGKIVDLQYVRMEDFIMIYSGARKHVANPKGQNLFKKHGIDQCSVTYDQAERKHYRECDVIANLWKLRYAKDPNNEEGEAGYAKHKSAPNDYQVQMLSAFGIKLLNDFAFGDNAWNLMQSADDPSWISSYSVKSGW